MDTDSHTGVFNDLDETNLAPSFDVAPQSLQPIGRLNGETGEREHHHAMGLVPYGNEQAPKCAMLRLSFSILGEWCRDTSQATNCQNDLHTLRDLH